MPTVPSSPSCALVVKSLARPSRSTRTTFRRYVLLTKKLPLTGSCAIPSGRRRFSAIVNATSDCCGRLGNRSRRSPIAEGPQPA
jgi:hypothetical protein